MNGHREPLPGEHYVALSGHLFRRRGYKPLHLAACWCWYTPLRWASRWAR